MAFADVLRRLRKQDGLTQNDIARRLGIAKSTVSMYECGRREPDFETMEAIADLFNVDMNQLTDHTASSHPLSPSERELLAAYRAASDDDRMIVDTVLKKYTAPKLRAVAAHGGGLTSAPADALDALAEQAIPTKDDL